MSVFRGGFCFNFFDRIAMLYTKERLFSIIASPTLESHGECGLLKITSIKKSELKK